MFAGRKLIIATKHQKEAVLAPILERELKVTCVVPENFDTDMFGTFTGETERIDDTVTTARKKCAGAMEQYQCDLAVSSEGSFGMHPVFFFSYADEEIIMFKDRKNEIEIVAREISTDTNFGGEPITTERELFQFAEKHKFPSHGLILRKSREEYQEITKGITSAHLLIETFHRLKLKYHEVFVETDMRAMFNPTRMTVIEKAARQLIHKIESLCPRCGCPGFGVAEIKPGLPCKLCGMPTRSPLSHIYTCQKCFFTEEQTYPHQVLFEDPMFCDHCNP